MQINYEIIDTPAKLKHIVKHLETVKTVAVDLEADSMYHYKEKVCLLQISTRYQNALIDPLAVNDLSPLAPLFGDNSVKKIFHGSDYDIRSLHRDFKLEINNLFDTQLASMFLGCRQTGLSAVVKKHFNIILEKKFQKKDWSVRPLPENMMRYAASDTIHLIPLAEILIQELQKQKRLDWVREECQYLSCMRYPPVNNDPLFIKFKGAGRLNSQRLNVLEALLQLRDRIAAGKDRPVFKIFNNRALMEIAYMQPTSVPQLVKMNVISSRQINMYANAIIKDVKSAMQTPSHKLPSFPFRKTSPISQRVHQRIDALKIWRNLKAQHLNLDPGLVCSKSLMTAIARRKIRTPQDLHTIAQMHKWRVQAFGDEITGILQKYIPRTC
ncbi:HRDC domain-containing protein [Desulfococcaceae bacterium HSG9]|nr:HRDC domain-containing protein [Desulfococcaceae bacterium HSG9]